jgi:hypothetical protein
MADRKADLPLAEFDSGTTLSYLDTCKQNCVGKDPHEQVADGKFHGWMSLLLS